MKSRKYFTSLMTVMTSMLGHRIVIATVCWTGVSKVYVTSSI